MTAHQATSPNAVAVALIYESISLPPALSRQDRDFLVAAQ
jgi:hypothetical protein